MKPSCRNHYGIKRYMGIKKLQDPDKSPVKFHAVIHFKLF